MALEHRHASRVSGAYAVGGGSVDTGTLVISFDESITPETTALIEAAFALADTQSLIVVADKDCTLKTNDSGTPDQTIALKAGVPLVWSRSAGYFVNPIEDDITALYVTTGEGTGATRIRGSVLVETD